MINETVLTYVILALALEVYEAQWQKAGTIIGMLSRMYEHYQKSIFTFLLMHPSFYFAMYFVFLTGYNEYALMLMAIKTLDIAMKIVLIKKVFIDKELTEELSLALLAPLHKYAPYIGVAMYPVLVLLALL